MPILPDGSLRTNATKNEVGAIYSDTAPERTGAIKDIGWRHEQSKACIHQSNALAERAIRATTEGTRSNLEQAGLSHCYWPHALEHACHCHNASNPRSIEHTPWHKHFGTGFPGPLIPFGCRIDYWAGTKEQRRLRNLDKFAPSSISGIFMGYHFQPGMKWKRRYSCYPSPISTTTTSMSMKPIRTHQIKVPDGKYTFPMKKRYLHVQAGLATDALERPLTQALEDQDAAPADEAGDAGGNAKEPGEPKKVIDPRTGKMVEIPEAGNYSDSRGTLGRRYAGSKKPTGIPTFIWSTMSASAKEKAIREEAAEVDHWERQGNQLVRYHYTARKEMFSPDLTDCPVDPKLLSPARTTHILPMGSQHITTDVDDWSVKRRGNRKFSFHCIGKTMFEIKPASACIRSDDPDTFPCMPTVPHSPQHREKVATYFPVDEDEIHALMALVARPVNQKELNSNPEAQKSLDVE